MDQINISIVARQAQKASLCTGFAWGIVNADDELVHTSAGVPGNNQKGIVADINHFNSSISTLILSIEPHNFYMKIVDLCMALDMSNCREIFIIERLDPESRCKLWLEWSQQWEGIFSFHDIIILPTRLKLAIKKYMTTMQPWVTAISSGGLDGSCMGLDSVAKELGFKTNFLPLVRMQQVLLFDDMQKKAIDLMSHGGYLCKNTKLINLKSAQDFKNTIHELYNNSIIESLLFCSPSFLSEIENLNCIDEIQIYLSPCRHELRDEKLCLENYKIISSELFGDFIRLTCIRRIHYKALSSLRLCHLH